MSVRVCAVDYFGVNQACEGEEEVTGIRTSLYQDASNLLDDCIDYSGDSNSLPLHVNNADGNKT